MEFVTRRIERWLWAGRPAKVPRWLVAARYGYALLRDFSHGDLTLRAMSLVYTTIIAVVPLLAVAFALMKGLGLHRDLVEPLLQAILTPLGASSSEITARVVGFVDNVSGPALAGVGALVLLYSALSMAQKVEGSFNFVWKVDRPRSLARRFSEYLSVMLVVPLVMSVTMGFFATLASTAAVNKLREIGVLGGLFTGLSALTPYLLVIATFTFLYVFVPNTRVRFVPALIGGTFAGALWAGGGSLFTSFVVAAGRNVAIYSGFAIVFVALLWLYFSWSILLLGAQLAFYVQNPDDLRLGQRAPTASNTLRERLALTAMLLVGRDFARPDHGWRIESLAARIRVPRHVLEPVAAALTSAGLLSRTNENRLIPARDLRRIALADILDAVRSSAHHSQHETEHDWNPTVNAVAEHVEVAIREALGDRTLEDLVDADVRAESKAADQPPPASVSPSTRTEPQRTAPRVSTSEPMA
jgi:membrane protein